MNHWRYWSQVESSGPSHFSWPWMSNHNFLGWFTNHDCFIKALSSSKRNHQFLNGSWLPRSISCRNWHSKAPSAQKTNGILFPACVKHYQAITLFACHHGTKNGSKSQGASKSKGVKGANFTQKVITSRNLSYLILRQPSPKTPYNLQQNC